jgi:hypothetical protein
VLCVARVVNGMVLLCVSENTAGFGPVGLMSKLSSCLINQSAREDVGWAISCIPWGLAGWVPWWYNAEQRRKDSCICWESNPDFVGSPPHILITIPTELPRLFVLKNFYMLGPGVA